MPGTITKRGENTYKLTVSLGFDIRGKHIRKTKTVHCTEARAKKELALFYAECEKGLVSSGNIELSAFSDKWIEEYAKHNLKITTLTGYLSIINNHIKPLIGHNKLAKLKPIHIQEWVNLLSKTLSPKTVKNAYSVLRKILDTAVKWELISNNLCRFIDLPKIQKQEAVSYNEKEIWQLLDCLENIPEKDIKYRTAITITLFSGMRLGELMGLKWEDISAKDHMIHIQRARYHRKGYGSYIDTTKTESSKRNISLPDFCFKLLADLKEHTEIRADMMGNKWNETGFIMVNDFGEPLYPHQVSVFFRKFLKKNNLRAMPFHGLRHTHTSLLYYLNVNIVEISKRLGHSQISTTQNIYTHLFNDTNKEIAEKINLFVVK